MVSNGFLFAACAVPPVCLVLVIGWTLVVLRRFRRIAASNAPLSPHSLAQFRTCHPVFSPPPAPPTSVHPSPFPPPDAQPVLGNEFSSALPPAQPTPVEPAVSIHTTLSRTGTRVLTRHASSSQGHTPSSNSHREPEVLWKRLSGTSKERRRDKSERTRREKGKFGVGAVADESVEVAPASTVTSLAHKGTLDSRSVVDEPLRPMGRTRRRTSTWSAQDFDPLVSPISKRHSGPASLLAPNTIARPGPRPLPPGAGYSVSAWSAATSAVDLPSASALMTLGEVTVGGSQESGVSLMRQTSSKESRSPILPATPLQPYPVPTPSHCHPQHTPDVTETLRWSNEYSGHEPLPSPDDYTISARSSAYFGTTVLPMPTRTPSPTAFFPNTPTRLSMRDVDSPAFPSPVSHSAPPSRVHTRISHVSTATSVALADLDTYAASLSSSFAFPVKPFTHPVSSSETPLTAFPIRTSSRRQGSIPWFAADTPADVVEQDLARRSEEHEVFRRAGRPISWMPRQGSSGTLLDGVPQSTDLAVTNPDSASVKVTIDHP